MQALDCVFCAADFIDPGDVGSAPKKVELRPDSRLMLMICESRRLNEHRRFMKEEGDGAPAAGSLDAEFIFGWCTWSRAMLRLFVRVSWFVSKRGAHA